MKDATKFTMNENISNALEIATEDARFTAPRWWVYLIAC